MKIRKFKPGDRVEHKSSNQVMEVIRYEVERIPLVGELLSEEDVLCSWYENGQRKTAVYDQRTLTKSSRGQGLFKT